MMKFINTDTFELLCFICMLGVVLFIWFKNDKNIKRAIAYNAWTFIIFWINLPSFLVASEDLQMKHTLFRIPFDLYNLLGVGYIIFGNILLVVAGVWIGNSWEKKDCVDEKTIKKKFDDFSSDACELKIIGRDLDFLGIQEYSDQANHIKKIKSKAKLLCEQTDNPELIKLYQNLIQNGNQVRYYTEREGIANLKAQIKVDMHRKEYGLFAVKIDYSSSKGFWANRNKFEINNLESGFLLQTVSKEFERIFLNSLNPVIKCIALDLGGVYFDGDLDDFYEFLSNEFEIKINKKNKDKLNINDRLMLGEINIKEFIMEATTSKFKCKQLREEEWERIVEQWGKIWRPNKQMKRLFEYIGSNGFYIVPFSNLDRDNGNKYLREHYLPTCCTEHFFSYEQKCFKPDKIAFDKYFAFVKSKYGIQYPFQILLIDDQDKNISMAREQKWYSIKYINGKNAIKFLIEELKNKGIIPENFEIDKMRNSWRTVGVVHQEKSVKRK